MKARRITWLGVIVCSLLAGPGAYAEEILPIEQAVLLAQCGGWQEQVPRNAEDLNPRLEDFLDGRPKINRFRSMKQIPAATELSRTMSKELLRRGFKFVGPSIVYAFMQAVGMVNDHLIGCHRYQSLSALR